ncbi:MAG: DUF4251 domain-containing protein [Flavobacteriaceae bacterium]
MKTLLNVLLVMVFIGCGTSQKIIEPTADSQRLDTMVTAQDFKIEMEWAEPLMTNSMMQIANSGLLAPGNSASRINLLGNGNYLSMKGDSVQANLPYFGERQMGGGYGDNAGIKFNGVAKNLEIQKIEQKQAYQIDFSISEGSETYTVRMNLLANLKARIRVLSTQRRSIGYEGTVKSL